MDFTRRNKFFNNLLNKYKYLVWSDALYNWQETLARINTFFMTEIDALSIRFNVLGLLSRLHTISQQKN